MILAELIELVTIALYYAATRVVKGIFNQLGRAISNVGQAVGGDAGGAVVILGSLVVLSGV